MKKKRIVSSVGLLTLIIPLLLGGFPQSNEAAGNVYYVDPATGSDDNTGTSPNKAWESLDKVEETKFEAGDTIRLHEDGVFNDTLFLEGSVNGEGTVDRPITLESYGESGGKAQINGQGGEIVEQMTSMNKQIYSAVTLYNASGWTMRNFSVTNINPDESQQAEQAWGLEGSPKSKWGRVGVYVLAKDNGITQNIHLDDLQVTDVDGHIHAKDYGNGGIFFTVGGKPDMNNITRFDNISITNSYVANTRRTGISVGCTVFEGTITDERVSDKIDPVKSQTYGHTNVLIENNYVKDSGGDSIVPQDCYLPMIQNNVSDGASQTHAREDGDIFRNPDPAFKPYYWQVSAGIWPWLCYYPTFQFNEAFDTVDNYDGEGFDCDSGTGTLYQYNYSHDNEGGFMLLCDAKNFNSVIRYNISENDRKHLFLAANTLDPKWTSDISEAEVGQVYNNTFYTGAGTNTDIISRQSPGQLRMKNNIFYNEGGNATPHWQVGQLEKGEEDKQEHPATVQFDSNVYYGYTNLPSNEKNPIIVKSPDIEYDGTFNATGPEKDHERAVEVEEIIEGNILEAPGTGGIGLDSVGGYQLSEHSPAINAGITIEDNGGRDYFGNPLIDGKVDIGAHEYSGQLPPPISSTTEPTTSSTESSSSTKPTTSSTESSSSTKPTTSSTESSSSTKPTTSSTESSSSTKPTTSSTESSSSTKPTTSSTESSSSTKPTTSNTESSSSTKPTTSSTESSSSTKPTTSSTESSSSTKPTTSSTESSSSTKPTTSSTESSSSIKTSSSGGAKESSSSKKSSDLEEDSTSSSNTKKNIGSGASNTPKGSGGNKSESVIVRKYSVNQSSESSKKILPKTGSSSSQLLIFVGVLLIIGSFILIKQTNAIRK
ncbi:MAG: LPXTG cell wall anchor domain-containing protein [Enterococcus gilvus]|jgi:LPXTG-motif cell wall-anchored protein